MEEGNLNENSNGRNGNRLIYKNDECVDINDTANNEISDMLDGISEKDGNKDVPDSSCTDRMVTNKELKENREQTEHLHKDRNVSDSGMNEMNNFPDTKETVAFGVSGETYKSKGLISAMTTNGMHSMESERTNDTEFKTQISNDVEEIQGTNQTTLNSNNKQMEIGFGLDASKDHISQVTSSDEKLDESCNGKGEAMSGGSGTAITQDGISGRTADGGKIDQSIQMDYRTGDKNTDRGDSADDESDDSSDDDDDVTNQDAEKTINKSIASGRAASPERKVKLNRHGFEDMRTKGEIMPEELPPLEELTITVDETVQMVEVGTVSSVVGVLVIVQSGDNVPPLNDDTILFVDGHKVLGQVFEVFGPVKTPWYSVRFNDSANIEAKGIQPGTKVFCAPREESFTKFVFVDSIKKIRGSDASWEDNNEPPEKHLDYSDDEEEKRAKAKRKNDRKTQLQGTDGAKDEAQGTDRGVQQKKGRWQSWPPRDDSRTRQKYHQDQHRGHETYEGHKKQWVRPSRQQNFQTRSTYPIRLNNPQNHTQIGPNTHRYRGPPPRFGGPPDFQNQQRFTYQNSRPFNERINEHSSGFVGNQQNIMTGRNQFSQERPEVTQIDFSCPPPLLTPPTRFERPPLNPTNNLTSQTQQPNRMAGSFQQSVTSQNNRNSFINDSTYGGHFTRPNQPVQMRSHGVNNGELCKGQVLPYNNNMQPGMPCPQNDGPVQAGRPCPQNSPGQQPIPFNNNNVRPVGPDNRINGFMSVMEKGLGSQDEMNTTGYRGNVRDNLGQGHLEVTHVGGMDTSSQGQLSRNELDVVGRHPHNLQSNQQPFMVRNNQQDRLPLMSGNLQDRMNHGQSIEPANQSGRMNLGTYMVQGFQPPNMNQEPVILPNNQSYRVNQVPNMMQNNQPQRLNQQRQSVMPGNQSDSVHRGPPSVPLNPANRITEGPGMIQGNQLEPRANCWQGQDSKDQPPFIQGNRIYRCNNDNQHCPRQMSLENMNTSSGQFVNMMRHDDQNNSNFERNWQMNNSDQQHMQAFRNDRNSSHFIANRNMGQSMSEGPQQNRIINDSDYISKSFHSNSPQYNESRLLEDPRLIQGR